ncbi:MAG: hypothetical protein WAX07_04125 [Candidatus Altiarchaeia archaeon]
MHSVTNEFEKSEWIVDTSGLNNQSKHVFDTVKLTLSFTLAQTVLGRDIAIKELTYITGIEEYTVRRILEDPTNKITLGFERHTREQRYWGVEDTAGEIIGYVLAQAKRPSKKEHAGTKQPKYMYSLKSPHLLTNHYISACDIEAISEFYHSDAPLMILQSIIVEYYKFLKLVINSPAFQEVMNIIIQYFREALIKIEKITPSERRENFIAANGFIQELSHQSYLNEKELKEILNGIDLITEHIDKMPISEFKKMFWANLEES